MIADEPIYSITSKITTTEKIMRYTQLMQEEMEAL